MHLVRTRDARLETIDDDEGIVVPVDAERAIAAPQHLNLAGDVGLDPDGRAAGIEVPEHGTEDERGHRP